MVDTVSPREIGECVPIAVHPSDLSHGLLGELGAGMTLATGHALRVKSRAAAVATSLPPFADHVGAVVCIGALEEMDGVDAPRVVAAMTDDKSGNQRSTKEPVRKAVCRLGLILPNLQGEGDFFVMRPVMAAERPAATDLADAVQKGLLRIAGALGGSTTQAATGKEAAKAAIVA